MFGLFVATLLLAIPLSHFLWELAEARDWHDNPSIYLCSTCWLRRRPLKSARTLSLYESWARRVFKQEVDSLERTLSEHRGRPIRIRVITELLSLGRD